MLGGTFGSVTLKVLTKALGPAPIDYNDSDTDARTASRLTKLFGPGVYERMAGQLVVDFGSGRGADAVETALLGAGRVVGVEIRDEYLDAARRLAAARGVTERCAFVSPVREPASYEALYGRCDVVLSIDAFEHFDDPQAVLREMFRLLKPGGRVLISFGPPWWHPYGAHMGHFNRMPWLHVFFRESTILAVENAGATRFEETSSRPNRMTVRRFEQLAASSEFEQVHLRAVPIRRLAWLAGNSWTREFFTSVVTCEMIKGATEPVPG